MDRGKRQQSTKQEWTKKRQKSKDKEFTWDGCFEINSMFRTSVGGFFPVLSRAYNMVQVIESKIV